MKTKVQPSRPHSLLCRADKRIPRESARLPCWKSARDRVLVKPAPGIGRRRAAESFLGKPKVKHAHRSSLAQRIPFFQLRCSCWRWSAGGCGSDSGFQGPGQITSEGYREGLVSLGDREPPHTPNSPAQLCVKLCVIPLLLLLKHLRCNRCHRHTGTIVELCTPCAVSLVHIGSLSFSPVLTIVLEACWKNTPGGHTFRLRPSRLVYPEARLLTITEASHRSLRGRKGEGGSSPLPFT